MREGGERGGEGERELGKRIGQERNEERRELGRGRAERRGRVRIIEKEMERGKELKLRAKG